MFRGLSAVLILQTRFGENRALLFAFSQYLSDRDAEKDYNGPLTRAILEVRVICGKQTRAKLTGQNR